MKEFLSKLNLYELLTMLIPGGVLLFVLGKHLNVTFKTDIMLGCNMDFVCSVAWVIAAYLIGLVHNSITDWWWNPFRNNPIAITFSATEVKSTKLDGLQAKSGCLCYLLSCPCFLIRGLAMLIVVCLSPLIRLLYCLCPCLKPNENSEILNQYYAAYYYAEKHRPNTSYGNVEYQVAFCRNMLVPLILFTQQLGEIFNGDSSKLRHLMIAFIVVLAFFVVSRQEKLYQMILEDYTYLKEQENETKN